MINPDLHDFLHKVEFYKVIEILQGLCNSSSGKRVIKNLNISTNSNYISNELDIIFEVVQLFNNVGQIPLDNIHDLSKPLNRIHLENFYLSINQFTKITLLCNNINEVLKIFGSIEKKNFPKIIEMSSTIEYNSSIELLINKIITINEEIFDNASQNLQQIRNDKKNLFHIISSKLKSIINIYLDQNILAETKETIINDRRVLSIKSEYKRKINGIIHGESNSGKFVYIEPDELVIYQNRLKSLDSEEKTEIEKILIDLTSKIIPYKDILIKYHNFLALLDSYCSRAHFAIKLNCSKIQNINNSNIELHKAFHPILKNNHLSKNIETIPFDLEMPNIYNILLISGPNAGGKTICLKTVGLLIVMNQFCIPIPVEAKSKLPIIKNFFADIGDNQSIDNDISTFSSKMILWKKIISKLNPHTLILLDELGTGTDPTFGSPLSISFLNRIITKKAFCVATTHYSAIKEYGEESKNILSASMLFDLSLLTPTFVLSLGKAGSSYTLEIAKKIGLDNDLISIAKKYVNNNQINYNNILTNLQIKEKDIILQNNELVKNNLEVKKLIDKWNKTNNELELLRLKIKHERFIFNKNIEIETQKSISIQLESIKKVNKLEDLKSLKIETDLNLSKLNNEIKESTKKILNIPSNIEFKEGDKVKIFDTNKIGFIEKIENNLAHVNFDTIKMKVSINDLIPSNNDIENKDLKKKKVIVIEKEYSKELDLREKFAYEVNELIEIYLNNCLLNRINTFKIIHGRGVVKKEVLNYIKKSKHILKFYHPDNKNGGDGATIIEI